MTRALCLLTLYLGTALGQASLYTYIQTSPGTPWKWGRLILDPRLSIAPAAGSPCNAPEPCYQISFPAYMLEPPGTAAGMLVRVAASDYRAAWPTGALFMAFSDVNTQVEFSSFMPDVRRSVAPARISDTQFRLDPRPNPAVVDGIGVFVNGLRQSPRFYHYVWTDPDQLPDILEFTFAVPADAEVLLDYWTGSAIRQ